MVDAKLQRLVRTSLEEALEDFRKVSRIFLEGFQKGGGGGRSSGALLIGT
jgi:hypothetical protein